ncbi:LysR family transcriptional regulator [Aeromonas schubertii]|uniref:LysR family transcriptional regulator n=1 Tax=Aeromonas schubertii TaxID=652 RepID=UPI0010A8ACF4|nr:LysR family transcriptional regulator [Aeromonas schubertii]MBZ6072974.1 LysR family transcriptional regulator [Aeromonas schubertii]QCG47133.1 LysR family transcriptional regulator [Aeromonas schubertii]
MDIRPLRAFVAVFEERNITAAAARLFITQPTLSATLKGLEEELGTALFTRQARGVEATEAARRLYPGAKRLIGDAEALARSLRAAEPHLELTVGIEGELGAELVGALSAHLAAIEGLRFTLAEGCCGDLRLGCESLRCEDELFLPLLEEPFLLALPPGHPLAGEEALAPERLAGECWVMCPHHYAQQRLLAILGNQAPVWPQHAGTLALAARMVAAGVGIAWLPASLIAPGCARVALAAPPLKRRLGLCYSPDALRLPAVVALMARLRADVAP